MKKEIMENMEAILDIIFNNMSDSNERQEIINNLRDLQDEIIEKVGK